MHHNTRIDSDPILAFRLLEIFGFAGLASLCEPAYIHIQACVHARTIHVPCCTHVWCANCIPQHMHVKTAGANSASLSICDLGMSSCQNCSVQSNTLHATGSVTPQPTTGGPSKVLNQLKPVQTTMLNNVLRCVVFASTLIEMQHDARIDSDPILGFPCIAFLCLVAKKPLTFFSNKNY